MYSGRPSVSEMTEDWVSKTNNFLDLAFARDNGPTGVWCPCSRCRNMVQKERVVMSAHLGKYGFMPDYHRWVYHGESEPVRPRKKKVRRRTDDAPPAFDTGVDAMLEDFANAHAPEN